MRLSEQYQEWLRHPERFHDRELAHEFNIIFQITKDQLQLHVEPTTEYRVKEEKTLSIVEQTAYIKELFDDLYEHFIPWQPVQTEEYRKKAENMRTFLEGRPLLFDTPYFQQNIGRQRLKIIQYWIENMGEKE
ncbi:hypothetical protein [Ammoniphilus sp. 3BR4]|uniref:hypothetical protein n=1 Tax=Ammoniphilus sp. 3BR4 TaxID=3158265 RepID=UPI0034653D01